MQKGIYDLAADEVIKRYGLVRNEIIRRNKGIKPFRKEEVSPKEQLFKFSQMTEQDFEMMNQIDPEGTQNYIMDMQDLQRRYNDTR